MQGRNKTHHRLHILAEWFKKFDFCSSPPAALRLCRVLSDLSVPRSKLWNWIPTVPLVILCDPDQHVWDRFLPSPKGIATTSSNSIPLCKDYKTIRGETKISNEPYCPIVSPTPAIPFFHISYLHNTIYSRFQILVFHKAVDLEKGTLLLEEGYYYQNKSTWSNPRYLSTF